MRLQQRTLDRFLKHYGTKGMRWGHRKDRASKLSDSELRARVNRLNMEQQYSTLVAKEAKASEGAITKGARIAGGVVANSGKSAVSTVVTQHMTSYLTKKFPVVTGSSS